MSVDIISSSALPVDVSPNDSEAFQDYSSEPKNSDFMDVCLTNTKKPKRVLHFSDGVLEEYSTEEEDEKDVTDKSALVDPRTLTWMPYMWYLVYWVGTKTLSVCDYLGENLAHFFGITTPKYQYEIEEYQRILQEEEEAQRKEDEERAAGWLTGGSTATSTEQLTNVEVEQPALNISFKKVSSVTHESNGQHLSSSVQWERF